MGEVRQGARTGTEASAVGVEPGPNVTTFDPTVRHHPACSDFAATEMGLVAVVAMVIVAVELVPVGLGVGEISATYFVGVVGEGHGSGLLSILRLLVQ